jgi:uncharacterized membrane protein YhaH (DUF805 family)
MRPSYLYNYRDHRNFMSKAPYSFIQSIGEKFMKINNEPFWYAWVFVAALLYAIWASEHLYHSDPNLKNGVGIMVVWIIMPFVFCVALGIAAAVFGLTFRFIKDPSTRACLLLVAFGVFLLGYGKPSIFVILLALISFPLAYFQTKKTGKDEKDLHDFMKK